MLECLTHAQHDTSPFERLVAFDVYDGPVTGVVFCRDSSEAGLFKLLAWDDSHQRRIFELSPLDSATASQLLGALEETQASHWPEWWLSRLSTESEKAKVADAIVTAMSSAMPPSHIVVSVDLLAAIADIAVLPSDERETYERMNVRSSPDAEVTETSFDAWVAFVKTVPHS